MKQNPKSVALIIFLLLILSSTLACGIRDLKEREKSIAKNNLMNTHDSDPAIEDNDSINELMGAESCNEEDEACRSRRMVSEAHLDYIYTQHHKH